jgi:hypothetical protein
MPFSNLRLSTSRYVEAPLHGSQDPTSSPQTTASATGFWNMPRPNRTDSRTTICTPAGVLPEARLVNPKVQPVLLSAGE